MYDPYSTTEKDAGYYLAHPIPIPPPPPEHKPKKHRRSRLFIVLASLVVVAIAFLCGQYWSSINHAKEPISSPTMKSNYTVTDIVTDMKKDGCPCGQEINCPDGGGGQCQKVYKLTYSTSIAEDLGYNYSIDIQAVDSATWSDPPNDLQAFSAGLWVYNSSLDAQSAYKELRTEIISQWNSQPGLITPTEYLHGRCLVLLTNNPLADQWSGYQQALNKYCI